MATYTVTVAGQCSGGEHITLTVKRNGVAVKNITVTKTDLLNMDLDGNWETVIFAFIREKVKSSGAVNAAQAKTAVEAASWVF